MMRLVDRVVGLGILLLLCGCVSQPPTKAHTHIGHSITGAYNTPGEVGYFVVAEQRAEEALQAAQVAASANSPQSVKASLAAVQTAVISGTEFPMANALQEAVSHIKYAATSEDASTNVIEFAAQMETDVRDVVERIGLIDLYAQDALRSDDEEELKYYADEIYTLCAANSHGTDVNGSGTIGDSAGELGLQQIRQSLEAMIDREDPPYATVPRWYLFNLVRREDGEWIFRPLRRGESRGY